MIIYLLLANLKKMYIYHLVFMKFKPMNIVFIGAIIVIIGSIIAAFGTWKLNKTSSKRMQAIQYTGEEVNIKSEQQLKEIERLKNQNESLKLTADSLNEKATAQYATILELSQQNSNLSLQSVVLTKIKKLNI